MSFCNVSSGSAAAEMQRPRICWSSSMFNRFPPEALTNLVLLKVEHVVHAIRQLIFASNWNISLAGQEKLSRSEQE